MDISSVCRKEINYNCKTCEESICNHGLGCYVPVEDGSIPGWLNKGRQIEICHPCKESSKGDLDGVNPENLTTFDINCASRGFHVYRSSWKPKIGGKLKME